MVVVTGTNPPAELEAQLPPFSRGPTVGGTIVAITCGLLVLVAINVPVVEETAPNPPPLCGPPPLSGRTVSVASKVQFFLL